ALQRARRARHTLPERASLRAGATHVGPHTSVVALLRPVVRALHVVRRALAGALSVGANVGTRRDRLPLAVRVAGLDGVLVALQGAGGARAAARFLVLAEEGTSHAVVPTAVIFARVLPIGVALGAPGPAGAAALPVQAEVRASGLDLPRVLAI